MDKVERILELISEKSRGLQEEYTDLVEAHDAYPPRANIEDLSENLGGQSILDELYREVKLIQKQDD